ncbi:MAG: hypothetical protein KC422_06970 [Trueperaceae bacterium]|nr:hypothetical protein [Trueperaceae bacterium]
MKSTVSVSNSASQALANQPANLVTKTVGLLGLLAIIYVHFLDLPGKIEETPYLGYGYIILMLGCALAAGFLLFKRERRGWLLGGVMALGAILVYAINRTVGLPMAMEDIGNWTEPLGVYSMIAEAIVVVAAGWALSRQAKNQ